MTAVVGIINRKGVAIASDSAQTLVSKNKAFAVNPKTDKVFLIKNHKIGIATYGNASFLEVPIENLIGKFSNESVNNNFETLKSCYEAFEVFLKTQIQSNSDLQGYGDTFIEEVLKETLIQIYHENLERLKASGEVFANYILTHFNDLTANHNGRPEVNQVQLLQEYNTKIQDYTTKYDTSIQKVIVAIENKIKTYDATFVISDAQKNIVTDNLFSLHTSKNKHNTNLTTGFLFGGFGQDELFPVTIHCKLESVLYDEPRIDVVSEYQMNGSKSPEILHFAQTQDVQAFIEGIHPLLKENLLKNGATLPQNILHANYKDPMMASIRDISPIELGNIAHSLVTLCSVRSRFSNSNAEGVGGDVQLLVLTINDPI